MNIGPGFCGPGRVQAGPLKMFCSAWLRPDLLGQLTCNVSAMLLTRSHRRSAGRVLADYTELHEIRRLILNYYLVFRSLCILLMVTWHDVIVRWQQWAGNSSCSAAVLIFLPPSSIWRPTGRRSSAAEVTSRWRHTPTRRTAIARLSSCTRRRGPGRDSCV